MIILALIVLGLCLGSFVNALVWRVHQQYLPKKKRAGNDHELSIISGRSMCPHCRHTLTWYDLLPIISWLQLRGKCRYCSHSIGWQYPAVEAAMVILFVTSYLWWPAGLVSELEWLGFATWLLALVGLLALFVYDLRWMLLPNRIVYPLILLGTVSVATQAIISPEPFRVVFLGLGGLLVAGGIFYGLFQISAGKWIGGGDVKLGFALGLFLGTPILAFLMLFIASVFGLVVALPSLTRRKNNLTSRIPFGPYLILATVIIMLFGQIIVEWYSDTFLYI